MSSRAIKRIQPQEERLSQATPDEDHSSEDERGYITPPAAKPNPFALLDEDSEEAEEDDLSSRNAESCHDAKADRGPKVAADKKKKKKKRKSRGKSSRRQDLGQNKRTAAPTASADHEIKIGPDEIDLALKALAISQSKASTFRHPQQETVDHDFEALCSLLAIDQVRLNAENEMRQLFGRAALETDPDDRNDGREGRRRGRDAGAQGLANAVAGHRGPGGTGLVSLALRRNIFIRGKEEWPRAPGGGLGMEVEHECRDGITVYRFVHNTFYQDVQRQFLVAVESMQAEWIVHHLQHHPYHISTLLQVSEIAKHQRDHATAGDLLERALFSFGRAIHPTFADRLSRGKARLNFCRPENREFWLAGWRYIGSLGMRATWRTAYEWAKLLLSLDPEGDHYCIGLIIDQLALRSHQAKHFVDLASASYLSPRWSRLPNISTSLALAQLQLGQTETCRRTLFSSIKNFPWLFNGLFQELGMDRIPPSVWGSEPRTEHERLLSELYFIRAADLWKAPEAASLLVEVAGISEKMLAPGEADSSVITLDEARQVLLSDDRRLVALVPQRLSSQLTSTSDPLPPPDNMASYVVYLSSSQPTTPAETRTWLSTVAQTLRRFFPQLGASLPDEPESFDDIERGIEALGGDMQQLLPEMIQRLRESEPAPMVEEDDEDDDDSAEDDEDDQA